MIVIADGGSTTCEWMIIDPDRSTSRMKTIRGINPYHFTSEDIRTELSLLGWEDELVGEVDEVYFFGAGCGPGAGSQIMGSILKDFFVDAAHIHVSGDIEAAVYATASSPAVVGILGTGSHACFYHRDGIQIRIPALGHHILDYGSGSMIGRELLRSFFLGKLPQMLHAELQATYPLEEAVVKEELYQDSKSASAYLAGFARFVIERKEHPSMNRILEHVFQLYLDDILGAYREELMNYPVHLVGSIAYHCKEKLSSMMATRNYQLGVVIDRPINGMKDNIDYIREVCR